MKKFKVKHQLKIIFIVLALTTLAVNALAQESDLQITVSVKDASGAPVADALVMASDGSLNPSGITDDAGRVVLNTSVTSVDRNGITETPDRFTLLPNYPNPFSASTTLAFSLRQAAQYKIEIYNLLGQLVRTIEQSSAGVGITQTLWDGRTQNGAEVAPGIYFYMVTGRDASGRSLQFAGKMPQSERRLLCAWGHASLCCRIGKNWQQCLPALRLSHRYHLSQSHFSTCCLQRHRNRK